MSEQAKMGSLLFLSGCIMAVWIIALTTVPVQRESYHTGFTIKYANTSEMETQTDPTDFFDTPNVPESVEASELYCSHGICTRSEHFEKEHTQSAIQHEVQSQLQHVQQQSQQAEQHVRQQLQEVEEHVKELVSSTLNVTSFQYDIDEPKPYDTVILGVNKQQIMTGDPFNLEKKLKSQ